MSINIEGLEKPKILAALYNASRPLGMGFLHYDPKPMAENEAKEILKTQTYFDYLKGRVMKIDLASDKEFSERLYDRDNGDGAALRAIDQLRTFGTTEKGIIGVQHELGKREAAADALALADTQTTNSMENGVATITLGANDLGPQLKEAVKKAL